MPDSTLDAQDMEDLFQSASMDWNGDCALGLQLSVSSAARQAGFDEVRKMFPAR